MNHKRVYRTYSETNAVRQRKKAWRSPAERVPLQLAQNVNVANGRRMKFLAVTDDFP